ncbi:GNAT family N-acetyltransferase [Candidatus Saccharibacteria bacterium]|nr:GNAT family N-acetyltransferase [Candidatus Saccharibacteria bacterium]
MKTNYKRNDVLIRSLTKDDVVGAAQVVVEGWRKAYKGIIDDEYLDSLDVDARAQGFAECVGDDNFIVAVLDGKVVGLCRFVFDNSFSPDIDYVDSELMAIYTHPDLKGQGIGAKMFKYAVKKLKDDGKRTMIVWCLKDNVDSVKFYEHMGGEVKEERMTEVGGKEYAEVGLVYNLD